MRVVMCAMLIVLFVGTPLIGFLGEVGTVAAKEKEKKDKKEKDKKAEDSCPAHLQDRLPDKVLADHLAALAAADWEAVACNYHPDAFVINDQGVLIGRQEIVSAAMSLDELFSGAQRVIVDELGFEDVARVHYKLDGGWIEIPDGTTTYHIENGRIRSETEHGVIKFNGPPPDQQ